MKYSTKRLSRHYSYFFLCLLNITMLFILPMLSAKNIAKKDVKAKNVETVPSKPSTQATTTTDIEAEWTVLVYAQAKNSLSNFAQKNFDDMKKIGSTKDLNILVQWYQFGQQGVWRYKVEKGKMELDVCSQHQTDGNNAQDLVDSMQWAVSKYPAKKYCLILWNHGIGVLDPLWGSSMFVVNPKVLNSPRIQIAGLTTHADGEFNQHSDDQSIFENAFAYDDFDHYHATSHRGILFNEQSKTYMDNQNLSKALSDIKTKVLKNKKIDILGMDACLMAMVEVGYQVRNYADYLVGSQEVELAHGWNYALVCEKFNNSRLSPIDAAKGIVSAYETHYKNKIHFHTQSAIDLSKITYLKEAVDKIVADLALCKTLDNNFFELVKKARGQSAQLSAASYIDLHSFLLEFSKILATHDMGGVKKDTQVSQAITALQKSLQIGMRALEETVVSNTTGKYLERAKGLSIYFPLHGLDNSYVKTEFARDGLWAHFLQELTQNK